MFTTTVSYTNYSSSSNVNLSVSKCLNNNDEEWRICAGCDSLNGTALQPWKILVISTVSFLAVPSNLLVMLVIAHTTSLQNNQGIYMLSLAISGMGTGLCFLIFSVRYAITGYGPANAVELDIVAWWYYVMITATLIITLGIGLDKLHQIKWSFSYDRIMTRTKVLIIVCTIWISLFILSILPTRIIPLPGYYYKFTGETVMFDTKYCSTLKINPLFVIRISMFIFMFVVLVVGYGTILAISRRHVKRMRHQMQVNIPLVNVEENGKTHTKKSLTSSRTTRRELKGWITSACVVLFFLICWLPFFFYKIIIAYKKISMSETINFLLAWFAMTHTSVNMAIYGGTYKPFRKGLKKFVMFKLLRRHGRHNDDYYTGIGISRKASDFKLPSESKGPSNRRAHACNNYSDHEGHQDNHDEEQILTSE